MIAATHPVDFSRETLQGGPCQDCSLFGKTTSQHADEQRDVFLPRYALCSLMHDSVTLSHQSGEVLCLTVLSKVGVLIDDVGCRKLGPLGTRRTFHFDP